MAAKERTYNMVWTLGSRLRNVVKRLGVLGRLEPALFRVALHLFPPPSAEVEVVLPSRMRMVVPPGFPTARSYASGRYEADVSRLVSGILKGGMTVIDLGANIGYYTLLASRLVGPGGRVYAFEPDPRNFDYLLRNISANDCGNVVAVEKAVSNNTGSGDFIVDPQGGEGRLSSKGSVPHVASLVVQTVSLDDFFASLGWPPIDLVKMDIEGCEKAALEGMRELTRRNPAMQLIMEFSPAASARVASSPEDVAVSLTEMGFRTGYIIERGLKPFAVAGSLPRMHATYDLLLKRG